MERLRIAMTHVDLPCESKGGVANQVHYYANVLVERGHDVTLFTFSPAYDECKYKVHTYPDSGKLKQLRPYRLAMHLARTDFSTFDILHAHGDDYLVRNTPAGHIRTFHGLAMDEMRSARSWKRKVFQRIQVLLERRAAQVADVSVGNSVATQKNLAAIRTVIPCGVDTSRFSPGTKAPDPVLLFVGTRDGRKRGQFLADAFVRDILPKVPNAKLWAVSDNDLTGEGIVNYGRVSLETLVDLYRRAWVFCLPSTYEGFGVPYIEAMASGTVAVATPNPGGSEVLGEGKFGKVVPDGELGTTLRDLLSDKGERERLIASGTERVKDFDWQTVAEQYEKLYQEVIAQKRSRSK